MNLPSSSSTAASNVANIALFGSSFKNFLFMLAFLFVSSCQGFVLGLRHHYHRDVRCATPVEEPLIPEENPMHTDDEDRVSTAGVSYRSVLHDILLPLYPAAKLGERLALSRSEGYWPYIHQGAVEAPKEFTYGEFDFYFFAHLLDQAAGHNNNNTNGWQECVFTDLGSGTGRLVYAAAALHPWKKCRGIEMLSGLHNFANETKEQHDLSLLAQTEFMCGSMTDPYVYFGDSDLVFCFSTCLDITLLEQTAQSIGRQCRPGTIVITTDYALPTAGYIPPLESDDRVPSGNYRIQCIDKIEGWCWLTGGASTAYIHEVVESLWTEEYAPLDRPVPSLQEIALKVAKLYESGELTDTEAFKRNVYNNMVFHGIPQRFFPKLKGK